MTEKLADTWKNLPYEDKICCLIAYSSVFKDVVEKKEIYKKLGRKYQSSISSAITNLVQRGVLIEKNGFLTVKPLEFKIEQKKADFILCEKLIQKKLRILKVIGKLPFIDFVGISGSVAAKNPVPDNHSKVDVDIFIITANNWIWFVGLLVAIYRNLIPRTHGCLCINHIWDGSDMNVYNKNFYVATEIFNLIPVSGHGIYWQFLKVNEWVKEYFPYLKSTTKPIRRRNGISILNKVFYVIFIFLLCLKRFSVKPLKDLTFKINWETRHSIYRKGAENGGYQQMIQHRFLNNLKKYFPNIDAHKIEASLFPDFISSQIRLNNENLFPSQLGKKEQQRWKVMLNKYKIQYETDK